MVRGESTGDGTFEKTSAKLASKDQLWFYKKSYQERVAQAEKDFVVGRSVRTKTPDEAQQYLDGLKAGETGQLFGASTVSPDTEW